MEGLMTRARAAFATALATAGLLTAACGIPTGGSPTAIARSDVPFHLLSPGSGSTPTTSVSPSVGVRETIFLVATNQHVVGVSRDVAVPTTLADTLNELIGALLEGPTAEESALGYQSFLTGTKAQVSVTVSGTIATVNFTGANPVVVGPDQTLAIAQIVFTATQPPFAISGVSFEIAGTPIAVPTASGAQVPGPVNYLKYLPQAPTS
ncbi:MAG TPA: GerMN domain-containing protein [Acidimicrobiales bacterium]|nr:GerMN domain-containing protein [Acidimicrobiales bacterium]